MTSPLLARRREAAWRSPRDPATRRLGGAIGFSAVLHVAAIVAVLVWRGPAPAPAPPVYAVSLVAAPPGPRAVGVVDPNPPPAPAPSPEPAAAQAVAPTPPARAETRPTAMPAPPTAKPAPRPPPRATPTPAPPKSAAPARPTPARPTATAATDAKPAAKPAARAEPTTKPPGTGSAAPRAGGGPEGGRGTDVANVDVKGLQFPFPGYLQNIVRQVALRFSPPNRNAVLTADVAFLIHRDGSVSDVRIVKRSGNYGFDLEARGAIEAVGQARAFGPLPDGFRDDVLPVTFSFDPRIIR